MQDLYRQYKEILVWNVLLTDIYLLWPSVALTTNKDKSSTGGYFCPK